MQELSSGGSRLTATVWPPSMSVVGGGFVKVGKPGMRSSDPAASLLNTSGVGVVVHVEIQDYDRTQSDRGMIVRSTLLIPSERPPTLRDLKVALLTYDTVQLLDPDDRDLFPSTGMGIALGMPPIMSVPSNNPVRRIGKIPSYDDDFTAVVDAAKAAIYQGMYKNGNHLTLAAVD